jgi:hypothetical protein
LIPVKKLLTTAVDGLGAAAAIFKDCSLIVALNVTPQQCRNGKRWALPPPTRIMDLLISTNYCVITTTIRRPQGQMTQR